MKTVGIGIVGVGAWSATLARAASQVVDAQLVACYARDAQRREAFARENGCRATRSVDELLDDPSIQGILIATPHSTHVDLITRSASSGRHVFVEKPLSLTVAEGARALAATSEAGVILQVGHGQRRQTATRRLRKMIDDGVVGEVLQLEGNITANMGNRTDLPEWRNDPQECPAGGMTALGVHVVDDFHYLAGPATRVMAWTKRTDPARRLDDVTSALIEFESGAIGYLGTSLYGVPSRYVCVRGTEAIAWSEMDAGMMRLSVQQAGGARSDEHIELKDVVLEEITDFVRSIRDGTSPETGGREGLAAVAVLEGIVESSRTGCAIDLRP